MRSPDIRSLGSVSSGLTLSTISSTIRKHPYKTVGVALAIAGVLLVLAIVAGVVVITEVRQQRDSTRMAKIVTGNDWSKRIVFI